MNPDTVQFQGDAEEDRGLLLSPIDPASDAANKARITKQIAVQLATRFEATPHPVSKHFRRGSLRSLTSPGASAVVMPLGISGEPVGQVTSINSLLIGGSDFAVAISRDSILALAAPTVAAIQGFNPTVHVHVSTPWPAPDIDTVYRVGISPPTVDWLAQGSYAVIKIKASGSAKTDSILPNADFDVEQDIILNFDAGSELLRLSAGSRRVTTHSSGLGSGEVADAVNGAVDKAVKSLVATACAQAQPSLDNMIQRKQELIDQLRTIDDHADAHFNNASFDPDGIVLSA